MGWYFKLRYHCFSNIKISTAFHSTFSINFCIFCTVHCIDQARNLSMNWSTLAKYLIICNPFLVLESLLANDKFPVGTVSLVIWQFHLSHLYIIVPLLCLISIWFFKMPLVLAVPPLWVLLPSPSLFDPPIPSSPHPFPSIHSYSISQSQGDLPLPHNSLLAT